MAVCLPRHLDRVAELRLLVIVNPVASRSKEALPDIAKWLSANANAELLIAETSSDLEKLLTAQGPAADRIVIGGGDGTLSEALPILLKLGKPLAVIPLGTANDFARTLDVPADPLEALQTAFSGRERKIDVGFVNDRPYLNVASVGVASELIKQQSKEAKRRWKVLAYPISLLQALRKLQPFIVDLCIDDSFRWSAAVYQVSIGNGRHHGGGLVVADDAALDDGKLDLYVVYPGTFWQLLACLTHLRFGLIAKPKVLDRHSGTRVNLSTSRPRDINADGGLVTKTPAAFTLMPNALRVIVPMENPWPFHSKLRSRAG